MAEAVVAQKVPFSDMCNLFVILRRKRSASTRKDVLAKLINSWRAEHKKVYGDTATTDSFYPAMRLILPSFDKDRGPYGIKEHMLAKKLIDRLLLDKNSSDAQKLLNFRSPAHISENVGDFASVVGVVLKDRLGSAGQRRLSVYEINCHLDGIAQGNAEGKKAIVDRHLMELLKNLDALEMEWLTRIVLKQMKIGVSEKTVFNVYHPDAYDLYNVCSNLERVCRLLHDPTKRLDQIQIHLWSAFKPMLCDQVTPGKVAAMMQNRQFYLETKYDGERVQVHKQADRYAYFSRNGNDFTSIYGNCSSQGSLTPFIHPAFNVETNSCILDGEMCAWFRRTDCIATKGSDGADVRGIKEDDGWRHPCLVIFDCLMYNDVVLTGKTLMERLEIMNNIFKPINGRIMHASRRLASSEQDILDDLNAALEKRDEGVVVKDPESLYRLNVRANGGWIKVKPDYVDGCSDSFDFLIVGGYFGEGQRGGLMSHFLLAVAEETKSEKSFKSVCKVGSGYSYGELCQLNADLCKIATVFDKRKLPSWLKLGTEQPEVIFDPQKSNILEVKGAEIIPSDQFATGYTVRFPRVVRIRSDKSWTDCNTAVQFEDARKLFVENVALRSKRVADNELGANEHVPATKKRAGHYAVKPTVGQEFKGADLKGITKICDVFVGKEFYIAPTGRREEKYELEKGVAELGGNVTQNPGRNTWCVVCDRRNAKVENIIKFGQHDVAKVDWLLSSIQAKTLLPW